VEDLSAAGCDEVLACWSGLGYYRRARDLHQAARQVAERHGGRFPGDLEAARRLPGVGEYTAGAVLSIAYGLAVPAVDGNVKRVLSRLFAVEGDLSRSGPGGRIRELAGQLVQGAHPGEWNQALMELGATVCTPRSPSCPACPFMKDLCAAHAQGRQEDLPERAARGSVVREALAAVAVRRRGKTLLVRDREGEIVRGMWELPWTPLARSCDADAGRVGEAIRSRYGVPLRGLERRGEVRHAVMNRRLHVTAYRARAGAGAAAGGAWFAPEALAGLPLSSLARKILAVCD
jgi:A/G-specific adenine glycosylase